ncbi:flp operon protein C [Actinobacillus equuli]|nr:flp operon protein C [Actinobacillus equuli]
MYIQNNEQYILDSVRSGDTVSVFSQQTDLAHRERDQGSLVKLVDNLTVLQVKTFTAEENKQDSSHNKDFLGYISLKVDASMLKAFYSLDKQAKLIVLPTDAAAKAINHRGMFIRQLRGKIMRTNLFPKTLICSALLGLFAFSHAASAKTFTLEQGQSQLIKTDAKIDTVLFLHRKLPITKF